MNMGGNALRQPSCRLDKQELLGLIVNFNNEIGEPFKSTSSGVTAFRPIPFYTSKDSFGDLDMVVMLWVSRLGTTIRGSEEEVPRPLEERECFLVRR